MSLVTSQLIEFFQFIIIGIGISLIFDFFRAYRNTRKNSNLNVLIQDFIYFFLVTIIIICGVINTLDSSLRLYIFIAIILGICIYISIFSGIFLKLYDKIFQIIESNFNTLILPLKLFFETTKKILIFLKNYVEKSCKKFFYVISLFCNKLQNIKIPNIKIKRRGF